MQLASRWIAVAAGLCLTAACSESPPATAPILPAAFSAEVTSTTCGPEFDLLRAAIAGATFTGRRASADEANLLLKVNDAQTKLTEGKTADAIQKLEDVRTAVVALSTPDAKGKTKLDAAGAAAILAAIEAAEDCIAP